MVMGTFSKSLVSIGGFIASTHKVIDYLRHNDRPLTFPPRAFPRRYSSGIEES